jgi:hypothetical protein
LAVDKPLSIEDLAKMVLLEEGEERGSLGISVS